MGSNLTPEILFLLPFCQFSRFYSHFFSSCSFFCCRYDTCVFMWIGHEMTSWHMTSKCDVMTWNGISTNAAYTSIFWISLFFQIGPLMVTKILRRIQVKPWRHDIFMTSCHDAINTDFVQQITNSGSRHHRAMGFFLFLWFLRSRSSKKIK